MYHAPKLYPLKSMIWYKHSLRKILLNLHMISFWSDSSRISIKSCFSRSFRMASIDPLVSLRNGRIFFNADVPNSSPITEAAFISMIPLIDNSKILGFFNLESFPLLSKSSMFFNLLLWALDGTGTLVKFWSMVHSSYFSVGTKAYSFVIFKKSF